MSVSQQVLMCHHQSRWAILYIPGMENNKTCKKPQHLSLMIKIKKNKKVNDAGESDPGKKQDIS